MDRIYQQHWITLPKEQREHLTKVFEVPMSGIKEIRDATVISDGHTNEDLKEITLEKLNAYIGSEETFPRAWEITISKAKYELNPPILIGSLADSKPFCDSCTSKGVRHKKVCPKFK